MDGEGHSRVGGVTPHEFLSEGSLSLLWSSFTNPFADEPTTASPAHSFSPSLSMYDFAEEDVPEAPADRRLAEMEEGLRHRSGSSPGSSRNSSSEEGWYDLFDLTGYTSPILPQQSWSLRVAAGLEPPPVMYPATIPLPDTVDDEHTELDAIVISPRSLAFDRWQEGGTPNLEHPT